MKLSSNCKFFDRGLCRRGNTCRYAHIDNNNNNNLNNHIETIEKKLEMPPSKLERQLSQGSTFVLEIFNSLYSTIENDDVKRKLTIALLALKSAKDLGRINESEHQKLRDQMIMIDTNSIILFDDEILVKLSAGERAALEDIQYFPQTKDEHKIIDLQSMINHSYEKEENFTTDVCVVCGDSYHVQPTIGIKCQANHFHCKECIINWTKELLNQHRLTSISKHHGQIACTIPDCSTRNVVFSNSSIISLISSNNAVLEAYLKNWEQLISSKLFEEYQTQLSFETDKLKNIILNQNGKSDENSSQKIKEELEKEEKRKDLINLRKTIIDFYPNAKQCSSCKYGPMLKDENCDDLTAHDGQAVPLLQHLLHNPPPLTLIGHIPPIPSNESISRYNNHCPRCNAFVRTWSEWSKWDKTLPVELTNGIELPPVEEATIEESRRRNPFGRGGRGSGRGRGRELQGRAIYSGRGAQPSGRGSSGRGRGGTFNPFNNITPNDHFTFETLFTMNPPSSINATVHQLGTFPGLFGNAINAMPTFMDSSAMTGIGSDLNSIQSFQTFNTLSNNTINTSVTSTINTGTRTHRDNSNNTNINNNSNHGNMGRGSGRGSGRSGSGRGGQEGRGGTFPTQQTHNNPPRWNSPNSISVSQQSNNTNRSNATARFISCLDRTQS
eukprot:gene12252-16426_t